MDKPIPCYCPRYASNCAVFSKRKPNAFFFSCEEHGQERRHILCRSEERNECYSIKNGNERTKFEVIKPLSALVRASKKYR